MSPILTTATATRSCGQKWRNCWVTRPSSEGPTGSTSCRTRCRLDVENFLGKVERYNQASTATRPGSGIRQIAQVVEGVRHAALLRGSDFPVGAQKFRRRQDRPQVPRARQIFRTDPRSIRRGRSRRHGRRPYQWEAGLEGTMLGPSIFSGRVAGASAAHAAGSAAASRQTEPELNPGRCSANCPLRSPLLAVASARNDSFFSATARI